MYAASVLLCAIVGALISSEPVLSQSFLQVPDPLNVTVGAVAEFFCRANGAAVFWTVNDTPVNQLDDPNIDPDDGPVVDGVRTEILRIVADVQYNNSVVRCLSFTFGKGETVSVPALLMVQGLLSAPTNMQVSRRNASAIHLYWDPPFTLDITNVDPDIPGYTVSITNNNTNVTSERNVTEPEFLFQEEGYDPCHVYLFEVSAWNPVGMGEPSDVVDESFDEGLQSASRPNWSAIHHRCTITLKMTIIIGEIRFLEEDHNDSSSGVIREAWNPVGEGESSDVIDECFGGAQCPLPKLIWYEYPTAPERSACNEDTSIGITARVCTKLGKWSESLSLYGRVVVAYNSEVQDVTNSVPCIDDNQPDVNVQCDMKLRPYMYFLSMTVELQDSCAVLTLIFVFFIWRMLTRALCNTEQQQRLGGNEAVWKQVRDSSSPLNELQLQKISELITDWKPLARYLELDNPTIAGIEEDNRNSKERKYQMLYTWSQRKGDDATLKALLQCVEFDLGERDLAQRIVDTL